MANIIFQIGSLLLRLIDVYRFILIIYFLLTWLPGAQQSSFGRIISQLSRPYIDFFRQFIPPIGFISFAGLVGLLALGLIKSGLVVIINFLIRLVA